MNVKIFTISLVILFSIILWIFVSLSREYFSTVGVEVRVVDIPDEYTVGYLSDEQVAITLKGQGWMLAQPTFGETSNYEISVNNRSGPITLNLREFFDRNSWVKSNLQVVNIIPEFIDINIEKKIEKLVRVEPNVDLTFAQNYGITSNINLEPDSIKIIGPKSIVQRIDSVETVYTKIEGLEDDFLGYLQLKELKNISFDNSMVRVTFDVEKIVVKEFPGINIILRNVPPNQELVLIPNTVNIVLRGGIEKLGSLKASDVKVWINFIQAVDDTVGALLPNFDVPKGTEMLSISPEILNYKIIQY